MNKRLTWRVVWMMLIVIVAGVLAMPKNPDIKIKSFTKKVNIVQGLDLKGGTHLVYEIDLSKRGETSEADAVKGVLKVINNRINALGVAEPTIQTATIGNKKSIIVELPGISDPKSAIDLIGKTAKLKFYEEGEEENSPIPGFKETPLGGEHLKRADMTFQNPGGQNAGSVSVPTDPVVSLEFNSDGAKLFGEITKRNISKPVAIVIDNEVVTAPTVQGEISGGNAIITGTFTVKEAKDMAITLNSGALPVPLTLVQEKTIGATLGDEMVAKSMMAGLIGVTLVAFFMITYYGLAGLLAVISLACYTIIVVALFKLIPVTLSLAGIAGYILSIGAAVDANILIFERMKEERRNGKSIKRAIDDGFKRAWTSIRDSNMASVIISIILIMFGTGIVRGFAVTLLIGILVSMFTAITVSQTLLKIFLKERKKSAKDI